jgi:hypothetical protein
MSEDLISLMSGLSSLECEDRRDRVFAVLSLVRHHHPTKARSVSPDYSLTIPQLAVLITRDYIERPRPDLEIMGTIPMVLHFEQGDYVQTLDLFIAEAKKKGRFAKQWRRAAVRFLLENARLYGHGRVQQSAWDPSYRSQQQLITRAQKARVSMPLRIRYMEEILTFAHCFRYWPSDGSRRLPLLKTRERITECILKATWSCWCKGRCPEYWTPPVDLVKLATNPTTSKHLADLRT